MDYYSPFCGPSAIFMVAEPRGATYVSVINTRSFDRFWPVSWTIAHHFLVPERFPWLLNPEVCLRIGHQHSQFWRILDRFVNNTHCIWGSGMIPMATKPQVVVMCRSSTL